jgi:hypothetical protein
MDSKTKTTKTHLAFAAAYGTIIRPIGAFVHGFVLEVIAARTLYVVDDVAHFLLFEEYLAICFFGFIIFFLVLAIDLSAALLCPGP